MFADSDVYRGLAKRMNDTGLVEDNRNVEMGVSVHALKGVHIKIALFPFFVPKTITLKFYMRFLNLKCWLSICRNLVDQQSKIPGKYAQQATNL